MISLPNVKPNLDFITSGKLEKMEIHAFSDSEMQNKMPGSPMKVFINPESYTRDYKLKFSEDKGQGSNGAHLKYEYTEPSEMSFEFLFDCTGIIDSNPRNDISADIVAFKKLVYDFDGDNHQPSYVELAWGKLGELFKGRLTALTIQYKLFNSDGSPLRALVKANFKGSISDKEQAAANKKESPDLTHLRVVKAGDTLPLLCERIYEDPKYYLQVAKINRLGNFRQLKPGMELVFPPIEKISSKVV